MLSGLSTDLGLLNNGTSLLIFFGSAPIIFLSGKTWAYTALIIITAYLAKFIGGSLGGRAAGFDLRESTVIGTLLSCKGCVYWRVVGPSISHSLNLAQACGTYRT